MARVLCTIPAASESINGVRFTRDRGQMLSDDIPISVAETFASIPGFKLVGTYSAEEAEAERRAEEEEKQRIAAEREAKAEEERLKLEAEAEAEMAAIKAQAEADAREEEARVRDAERERQAAAESAPPAGRKKAAATAA